MFDVMFEDLRSRGGKPKRSEAATMNGHGLKSVSYSKQVTDMILKKEDKYVYAQAILNMTLSAARIHSKLYEKDEALAVKHLEDSWKEYEWLSKFMKEYMREQKIERPEDLPPAMGEPYRMMLEMVELLPVKIAKLNAKLKK